MNRAEILVLGTLAILLVSGRPELVRESGVSVAIQQIGYGEERNAVFGVQDAARFLEQANPALSANDVRRTAAAIIRNSKKYGLDPLLVAQVLWVESGARPWVRSPLGAVGLVTATFT